MSANGHDDGEMSALQHLAHKLHVPKTAVEEAIKWRLINHNTFDDHISPKSVIHVTSEYFQIGYKEIVDSKSRMTNLLRARYAAMYLMRELCVVRGWGEWQPISYQKISDNFNKPRHTYALHAHCKAITWMENDAKYKRDIENITALLGGNI